MPFQQYGELKHLPISPALRDYMLQSGSPIDSVVESLVERTVAIGDTDMVASAAVLMIPVEQAAFLTMLAQMLSAVTAIDIGTFTGLSALSLARGLVEGGRVITCDVTDKWADIAKEHWDRADVAGLIDFRQGPATETLRELPAGTSVDIAFIDADKENYQNYYELIVPLLRPGGLLVVDNVLFNGYALDPGLCFPQAFRDSALAIRAFNAVLAADQRMNTIVLPISDGMTIARKKE